MLPCPKLPLGFVEVCPVGDEKVGQQTQHEVWGYVSRLVMTSVRAEYLPGVASQPR